MVGGYGAGSGVFGPMASSLIERVGWRSTFQILSLLFLVMTMTATYLLRNPPAGYQPAGWDAARARAASRPGTDVPPAEMVRTRTFRALWLAYCLGTTAGPMVISQLVPFAQRRTLSGGGRVCPHRWRDRQHDRARALGLGLRPHRSSEHAAHHAARVERGDAGPFHGPRDPSVVLRAARRGLLLLRHAALGVRPGGAFNGGSWTLRHAPLSRSGQSVPVQPNHATVSYQDPTAVRTVDRPSDVSVHAKSSSCPRSVRRG
jgi:hypothetical protein